MTHCQYIVAFSNNTQQADSCVCTCILYWFDHLSLSLSLIFYYYVYYQFSPFFHYQYIHNVVPINDIYCCGCGNVGSKITRSTLHTIKSTNHNNKQHLCAHNNLHILINLISIIIFRVYVCVFLFCDWSHVFMAIPIHCSHVTCWLYIDGHCLFCCYYYCWSIYSYSSDGGGGNIKIHYSILLH